MGGVSGEERTGFLAAEDPSSQQAGGWQRTQTKPSYAQGVGGKLEGRENVWIQFVRMIDQGAKESVVCGAILAKGSGGQIQGAVEDCGFSVVQRVGERNFGMNPNKALGLKVEFLKNGGSDGCRVDGGANVVVKAR